MRKLIAAAGVAVALGAATPAAASTVQVSGGSLTYVAAADETNNVTVSLSGGAFTVTDTGPGIVVTAAAGCASVTPSTATCAEANVEDIQFNLQNRDDTATVTAARPAIFDGGDGNDTLTGGPLANVMSGGNGNDTLIGGPLEDNMGGNAGNDTLAGNDGDDYLDDGEGNDTIDGGTGDDRLNDRAGSDVIGGGPGVDYLELCCTSVRGPLTVTLDGVADDGHAGEGDNVLPDVEDLRTGDANDRIVGSDAANRINAGEGDDVVIGNGGADDLSGDEGNDTLDGGAGNDAIRGGENNDVIQGGAGDDSLEGGFRVDADVINGGDGEDTAPYRRDNGVRVSADGIADDGEAGEGDNVGTDVENLTGGDGDDVLRGNDGPNTLRGGNGADQLVGLAGGDELLGGNGADSLDGGEGRDAFDGGPGADVLRSRDAAAPDRVRCGAADDTVFAGPEDDAEPNCEVVSLGAGATGGKVKVTGRGVATVSVACPAVEGAACSGTATLRDAGGRSLGSRAFTVAAGATAKLKVKLSRSARKRLGRGSRRLAGRVEVNGLDAAGMPTSTAAAVTLTGAKR
jgi:Ca2+-binding RTX toxin-like protein